MGACSRRVALCDGLRARVTVEWAEGCGEDAVEAGERRQVARLGRIDEAARDPELVLDGDALLERRDVFLAVEEEEVSDLAEVDVAARSLPEVRERLDRTFPDRDVERIGELRADASGGPTRGAGRERVALEQADLDARLGEVERDARPDRATADDDDVRVFGHRHRHLLTRLRAKKRRFAGRSARRRIRYGYQSGPNGVATSTLYPSAAIERWSAGRTP